MMALGKKKYSIIIYSFCLLLIIASWSNVIHFQASSPRLRDLRAAIRCATILNSTLLGKSPAAVTATKTVAVVNCSNINNLLSGRLIIDPIQAEKHYWKMSKVELSEVQASKNGSKFLGPHNVSAADITKNITAAQLFRSAKFCRSSYNIAFVIPFRHREQHLKTLLGHLVPILDRQLLRYTIYVVEQSGNDTFNKGMMMNTGFEFAAAVGRRLETQYDCFIFHDVDLLPEYDNQIYRCPTVNSTMHFATTLDKYGYKRMSHGLTVGGVLAFAEREYRMVNGFSNAYWGWGGEDDDMLKRIQGEKIKIVRPQEPFGRYTMIKHEHDTKNPVNSRRKSLLKSASTRMELDGLSNLDTRILKIQKFPLFVKLVVDAGMPTDAKN